MGKSKTNVRKHVEAILASDLPGWNLSQDAVLPKNLPKDSYMVKVVNKTGFKKTVVIDGDSVLGAQG